MIDRSGNVLANDDTENAVLYIESEEILDEYRKSHLEPLTSITMGIQTILSSIGIDYYIAQRLKRKPQIIRKLRRFSARLTQMQDIAGCRIIVNKNSDVDLIRDVIKSKISRISNIVRLTDYRERGRDDTGYRALHIIMEKEGFKIELQIRSNIQHYWSENIERTSVVYGYYLKEGEGAHEVISYFKFLSDVLYFIESGYHPNIDDRASLESRRSIATEIIRHSDRAAVLDTNANEDIIQTLLSKSSNDRGVLQNWIIVFDWNSGHFITWDVVGSNPDDAMKSYLYYENQFPENKKYEVVLIGSSSIDTIRNTHSHYFGVKKPENILMNLEQEVNELEMRGNLNLSERQILEVMYRRRHWGAKPIAVSTLRNHFCREVANFNGALESLIQQHLIVQESRHGAMKLNIKKRNEIESYI